MNMLMRRVTLNTLAEKRQDIVKKIVDFREKHKDKFNNCHYIKSLEMQLSAFDIVILEIRGIEL